MREIKFRGKTAYGNWVIGSLIINNFENYFIESYNKIGIRNTVLVIPETVGQFTGLFDKNGKEIYEGDMMPIYENGEEYLYKVVYNGDCFMLGFIDSEQGSYPLSTKRNISEVIGNIHGTNNH